MPWPRRPAKGRWAELKRRAGRLQLLPAVALALTAGLIAAFLAYAVLHWITPTSDAKAAPIDITKVALTVVAGVGGVVALVIAYRRQRDLEQSRFVERFSAAAAQLGATDVAVRIAGVYAMAGVADESEGLHRQQCIDVLCGYLRLPYTPELGASHLSKRVRKHRESTDSEENEDHFEYRQNDREVRKTIVSVIADRLRISADHSWSACNFNFRAAYLESVDFDGTTFSGDALFSDATFSGRTSFVHTTFGGRVRFDDATFLGRTTFAIARFFTDAQFGGTTFSGDITFFNATFYDRAEFDRATFSGDARFLNATFYGEAQFGDASFVGQAGFEGVTFIRAARFACVTFCDLVRFDGSQFHDNGWFDGAAFLNDARFDGARFSNPARFTRTRFSRLAWFVNATFSGGAWFDGSQFSGVTRFDRVRFDVGISFPKVDFGTGFVSFARPRQWPELTETDEPVTLFDWSDDVSLKPANVEPRDWPPAVMTS